MWQRFTWYDVRVIGHYLGVLISFFSIALAVPLVVAVVCQEWEPACGHRFVMDRVGLCGGSSPCDVGPLRFLSGCLV